MNLWKCGEELNEKNNKLYLVYKMNNKLESNNYLNSQKQNIFFICYCLLYY